MATFITESVRRVDRVKQDMILYFGIGSITLPFNRTDNDFYRLFEQGDVDVVYKSDGKCGDRYLAVIHNNEMVYPK
ncbi:MAG: hypothetical protein HY518_05615 [Candidatus Aenigmarchaeota archaeon]|nr:hypothetical protein [Candidatus Aenigmarchaeota archaeon]